ncbi:MAG: VTC domain-containing protein [Candidatus Gracilibacteria bacterium]|jgi:hypothetical protein|nr:VTC domain-containing protein [Candidatus Gracilibacteria bacterium]
MKSLQIKNLKKINLKELVKNDSFFSARKEYKFIIQKKHMLDVLNFLRDDFCFVVADDDSLTSAYESVYLDTEDYLFFNLHRVGKLKRIKIRTRLYKGGFGDQFIECKKKLSSLKVEKYRYKIEGDQILDPDLFEGELLKHGLKFADLKKETTVNYNRINLISNDLSEKVTLDFDLNAQNQNGEVSFLGNYFILEVKSRSFPKKIAKFLKTNYRVQENGFSKYCIALCLLNKDLKKAKWKHIFKKYL